MRQCVLILYVHKTSKEQWIDDFQRRIMIANNTLWDIGIILNPAALTKSPLALERCIHQQVSKLETFATHVR